MSAPVLTSLAALGARLSSVWQKPRPVVAIFGESGTGKSTTATALLALRPGGAIIHLDDYYARPPAENQAWRSADPARIGPGEVLLDAVEALLSAFRAGEPSLTVRRTGVGGFENERLVAPQWLVVEGTWASEVSADCHVLLDGSVAETRQRRRNRGRDPDSAAIEAVLAVEHRLLAARRSRADIIMSFEALDPAP